MTTSRLVVCLCVLAVVFGVALAGQQRPAASAGAASTGTARGNVEHGRYLVERVVMTIGNIRAVSRLA